MSPQGDKAEGLCTFVTPVSVWLLPFFIWPERAETSATDFSPCSGFSSSSGQLHQVCSGTGESSLLLVVLICSFFLICTRSSSREGKPEDKQDAGRHADHFSPGAVDPGARLHCHHSRCRLICHVREQDLRLLFVPSLTLN